MYYDIEVKHARMDRRELKRLLIFLAVLVSPALYALGTYVFRDRAPDIPGSMDGFLKGDIMNPSLVVALDQDSADAEFFLLNNGFTLVEPKVSWKPSRIFVTPDSLRLWFRSKHGRVSSIELQVKFPSDRELLKTVVEWERQLLAHYKERRQEEYYFKQVSPTSFYIAELNYRTTFKEGWVTLTFRRHINRRRASTDDE